MCRSERPSSVSTWPPMTWRHRCNFWTRPRGNRAAAIPGLSSTRRLRRPPWPRESSLRSRPLPPATWERRRRRPPQVVMIREVLPVLATRAKQVTVASQAPGTRGAGAEQPRRSCRRRSTCSRAIRWTAALHADGGAHVDPLDLVFEEATLAADLIADWKTLRRGCTCSRLDDGFGQQALDLRNSGDTRPECTLVKTNARSQCISRWSRFCRLEISRSGTRASSEKRLV